MWILALLLALVLLVIASRAFGRRRGWRGDADPGRRVADPPTQRSDRT